MVSTQLAQITKKAELDRKVRFTSLAHLLTPEFLKETWRTINRHGAGGVDGESIEQFESELELRVQEICARLKAGAYRAPPVRRVDIPKGPGKTGTRPLGIPTVADRLLQKAVARILEAIFEADFCDASYGYRPGRSPHHALRAQIVTKKGSYVFEADIRGYFNHVCHSWLQRMVRERIADPVILSLIGKWLKAGAMQDGVVVRSEEGTPQGGPISCVLANIYLHYTLDCGSRRSSNHSARARRTWCASSMTSCSVSNIWRTQKTFRDSYGRGSQDLTWNWPRRKLGCCSLADSPPSDAHASTGGRKHSSFSASNMSAELIAMDVSR